MPLTKIFDEIVSERALQVTKHGGQRSDDAQPLYNFFRQISKRNLKAAVAIMRDLPEAPQLAEARRRLIQVAALAVAAIEKIDRSTDDEKP